MRDFVHLHLHVNEYGEVYSPMYCMYTNLCNVYQSGVTRNVISVEYLLLLRLFFGILAFCWENIYSKYIVHMLTPHPHPSNLSFTTSHKEVMEGTERPIFSSAGAK
jgi:hypothetical protein